MRESRLHGRPHVLPSMLLRQEVPSRPHGADHIDGQSLRGDLHIHQRIASSVIEIIIKNDRFWMKQGEVAAKPYAGHPLGSCQRHEEGIQSNVSSCLPRTGFRAFSAKGAAE